MLWRESGPVGQRKFRTDSAFIDGAAVIALGALHEINAANDRLRFRRGRGDIGGLARAAEVRDGLRACHAVQKPHRGAHATDARGGGGGGMGVL